MSKHTKASIKALFRHENIAKANRAIAKGVYAIYKYQTHSEKQSESTFYLNGIGFNSAHGKKGTGMGRFFAQHGFLTPKQIAWWRQLTPSGKMRIDTYAGQLARIANGEQ